MRDLRDETSQYSASRPVLISRREWLLVAGFALVLVILTSIPYVLAWSGTPPDQVFSGFVFGVEDGNDYIARMRLGAFGFWEFHLYYTAELHTGAPLLYLPYIAAGQAVGLFFHETDPGLTPALVLVYQAMRVVIDGAFVFVLYRFLAIFLRSRGSRLTALIIATFGGGFGWLLVLLGQSNWLGSLPPEFFIPEGFSFLMLLGIPHLVLARTALLGGFIAVHRALNTEKLAGWVIWSAVAGGFWFVALLAQPLIVVVLYTVIAIWGIVTWIVQQRFPSGLALRLIVAVLVTLPLFLYYLALFTINPFFARWQSASQVQLDSPHILHYLLAYGVMVFIAMMGVGWVLRRTRSDAAFALPLAWTVAAAGLVYLPLSSQRRLSEGVLIMLAILGVAGMRLAARHWARWRLWRAALFAVVLPSSLVLLLGITVGASHPDRPLFRPADEIAAFQWLDQFGEPDQVVLSAYETGNVLPAWALQRVHIGHGPETLDIERKMREVQRFYMGEMSDSERAGLFTSMRIRYVFYGPLERELATGADSDWASGLELLYDAAGYQIFEVPR